VLPHGVVCFTCQTLLTLEERRSFSVTYDKLFVGLKHGACIGQKTVNKPNFSILLKELSAVARLGVIMATNKYAGAKKAAKKELDKGGGGGSGGAGAGAH